MQLMTVGLLQVHDDFLQCSWFEAKKMSETCAQGTFWVYTNSSFVSYPNKPKITLHWKSKPTPHIATP